MKPEKSNRPFGHDMLVAHRIMENAFRAVRHDMWVANQSREFYHVPYGTKCCTPFLSCYPHSIPTGLVVPIKPASSLRDYERITLGTGIDQYYQCEVKPHLPYSSMDRSKDKTGYEINFTNNFTHTNYSAVSKKSPETCWNWRGRVRC
jgi:hypothetical protein